MRRRPPNYSIAWLLACTTVIAACLGVVVSPNMWTTGAVAAVRLFLSCTAVIIVLNHRARCPRVPVAFLAANLAYALTEPWHADSELVLDLTRILDIREEDQALIGVWHMWSLLWTLIGTLFITAFLKPRPLDWFALKSRDDGRDWNSLPPNRKIREETFEDNVCR